MLDGQTTLKMSDHFWLWLAILANQLSALILHSVSAQCYMYIIFYNIITEGSINCVVEDVLVFFTGADRIPPLGFNKKLSYVSP